MEMDMEDVPRADGLPASMDGSGLEDDGAECRVCRGEAEPGRRLFAPCKCSGSIRFTHDDCLEQWLEHSNKSFCELCGHEFQFKPLYDENAPAVLPWSELFSTMFGLVFTRYVPYLFRVSLVIIMWLGFAPWVTSWFYRMWMLRASAMSQVDFTQPSRVLSDIYAGIILVALIIFSFLALMSFADFLRFHLDELDADSQEAQEPVRPRNIPEGPVQQQMWEDGDSDDEWQEEEQAEDVANRQDARPPPPPPNNNQEWDDDMGNMEINIDVEELLGVRGDIVVLFRNVSCLVAFNGAYLGLFAFIPYTLGSTILAGFTRLVLSFPMLETGVNTLSSVIQTYETPHPGSWRFLAAFTGRKLLESMESANANGDCLRLIDFCTCIAGLLSICSTIVLWRFVVKRIAKYVDRPVLSGLLWALRYLTAIVKVSTLLILKMMVLPIVLGLGIDFATLQLFEATAEERVEFFMTYMLGTLLLHWVLGITFMLFVTVAVLHLREVMHPDILSKVIRPQENHPDLLRTLLSERWGKHIRRMMLSLAIYTALLVVLVHLPVRTAHALLPSLFPLVIRLQYFQKDVQVPLELLAVHFVVLAVLELTKNQIGRFQHIAIKHSCQLLGLSDYLLPRIPKVRRSHRRGQQPADVHILPPPPLHFHPLVRLPPDQLRVQGRRYVPWPEEGVEYPQPMEFDLLPRSRPTYLWLRLSGLFLIGWMLCVMVLSIALFATLWIGRVSTRPFERLTGIEHDPLAFAAGVEIGASLLQALHALNRLTLPRKAIDSSLLRRGYGVRNLTPWNGVLAAVGWGFVAPMMTGHVVHAVFPAAKCSLHEIFWLGYLLFNTCSWLLCAFRSRHRAQHARQRPPEGDMWAVMEELEQEEEEEFLNEMQVEEDEVEVQTEAEEDFVSAFRRVYRQVRFTVHVHESDAVRLRDDDLRDKCLDVRYFVKQVLVPILTFLLCMLLAPTLLSFVTLFLVADASSLEKTSFAITALGLVSGYVLIWSHKRVSRWLANVCESIRNERYLIGRQLQDMAR